MHGVIKIMALARERYRDTEKDIVELRQILIVDKEKCLHYVADNNVRVAVDTGQWMSL